MQHIYGDLGSDKRFAAAFEKSLVSLYQKGAEATIDSYLGPRPPGG